MLVVVGCCWCRCCCRCWYCCCCCCCCCFSKCPTHELCVRSLYVQISVNLLDLLVRIVTLSLQVSDALLTKISAELLDDMSTHVFVPDSPIDLSTKCQPNLTVDISAGIAANVSVENLSRVSGLSADIQPTWAHVWSKSQPPSLLKQSLSQKPMTRRTIKNTDLPQNLSSETLPS